MNWLLLSVAALGIAAVALRRVQALAGTDPPTGGGSRRT